MMRIKLFTIVLIALLSCNRIEPTPITTGREGKTLPSFSMMLIDSANYINTSDFKLGKPIVIIYITPNCPYCRLLTRRITNNMEMLNDIQFCLLTTSPYRELQHYYNLYRLNKFDNITVGIDTGVFFPKYFKTDMVPFVAIYGKDRKLNKSFIGPTSINQIKSAAYKLTYN